MWQRNSEELSELIESCQSKKTDLTSFLGRDNLPAHYIRKEINHSRSCKILSYLATIRPSTFGETEPLAFI